MKELSLVLSSPVVKRSVSIAGHMTSISLEQPFWEQLQSFAEQDGMTVAGLVAHIDGQRKSNNLSSAIRLYILHRLQDIIR